LIPKLGIKLILNRVEEDGGRRGRGLGGSRREVDRSGRDGDGSVLITNQIIIGHRGTGTIRFVEMRREGLRTSLKPRGRTRLESG